MFEKFLSPFGRLSRGGYWLWGVFVFGLVLTGAAMVADNFILGIDWMQSDIDKQYLKVTNLNSFQNVVFWLTLWPTTALAVKRLHDVGTTGWWYVGLYVISFVVWDLAAISGTQNENSFLSEIAPVSSFLSPEFFGEYVGVSSGSSVDRCNAHAGRCLVGGHCAHTVHPRQSRPQQIRR